MPTKRAAEAEEAPTSHSSLQNKRQKKATATATPAQPAFYGEIVHEKVGFSGAVEYQVRWEPTWVTTAIPVGKRGDIDIGGVKETGKVLKRRGGKALVEWTNTWVAKEDVAIDELEKWTKKQAAADATVWSPTSSPEKEKKAVPSTRPTVRKALVEEVLREAGEKRGAEAEITDAVVVVKDHPSIESSQSAASRRQGSHGSIEPAHATLEHSATKLSTPSKKPSSNMHRSPHPTPPLSDNANDQDKDRSALNNLPAPIMGESPRSPDVKIRRIQSAKHFGELVTRWIGNA